MTLPAKNALLSLLFFGAATFTGCIASDLDNRFNCDPEGSVDPEGGRVCRNGIWVAQPGVTVADMTSPTSDMSNVPDLNQPSGDMLMPSEDMKVNRVDMSMSADIGIDMSMSADMNMSEDMFMPVDMFMPADMFMPPVDMCMAPTQQEIEKQASGTSCGSQARFCDGTTVDGTMCSDADTVCDNGSCKTCTQLCSERSHSCGMIECNGQPFSCSATSQDGFCDMNQICVVSPQGAQECQQSVAIDAVQKDIEFGASIDLDGDYMVVGAPSDKDASRVESGGQGSVFLYKRNAMTLNWDQVTLPKTAANTKYFGASVAIDAKKGHLFVGDPQTNGDRGAVYLFEEQPNGTWARRGRIEPTNYDGNQMREPGAFGHDIAFSDTKLVVGAPNSEGNDSNDGNGVVMVFDRPAMFMGNAFNQNFKVLRPQGKREDAFFGWSVDISETRIAVGSPDEGVGDRGRAYLFRVEPNGDVNQVHRVASSLSDGSRRWFGFSVAVRREYDDMTPPQPTDTSVYATMPTYNTSVGGPRADRSGVVETFRESNGTTSTTNIYTTVLDNNSNLIENLFFGTDIDVKSILNASVGAVGGPGILFPTPFVSRSETSTLSGIRTFTYQQGGRRGIFGGSNDHHVGTHVDVSNDLILISAPTRDSNNAMDRVYLIRR